MKQQLLVKTTILPLAELSTIITLVCDNIDWEDHTLGVLDAFALGVVKWF